MIDNLKLLGFFLFVLLTFFTTISAQTLRGNIFGNDSQASSFRTKKQASITAESALLPESTATADKITESRSFGDFANNRNLNNRNTGEQDSEKPANYTFLRGDKEVNFELGYSPFEPTNFAGEKEYDAAGRKLGLAAFRWGRILGVKKGIAWQYMFETIPFLFSLKNEVRNPNYISPTQTPMETPTRREASYGFGITPGVIKMYFLPKSRIKPYLQFGGGVIFVNKPMPVPEAGRFNFTGYFGGGILYQISPNRGITFSYRYFHISNGNTKELNPGYNANVFAVGYSFFYK